MNRLFIEGVSFLRGDASSEAFAPFVQVRQLRRMETIAKNVLLCSFRACEQAQITDRSEMGISISCGAGSLENTCKFLDSIIQDGDELSSPTAFAGSVHNATGLTLSLFLGSHGPCVTTGQLEGSFGAAFLTAQQFLAQKMCPRVLVAVTEDINPVAADLLPADPARFAALFPRPQGPFERVAAAFVVTAEKTPRSFVEITRFEFARRETPMEDVSVSSPAYMALQAAERIAARKPFLLHTSFAGTDLLMEGQICVD